MKVLSAPARIVWEVTDRCNLQCTYCYRDSGNKSILELSEEEFPTLRDVVAPVATSQPTPKEQTTRHQNQAYTEQELTDALGEVGFENVERFPSLSGKAVARDADLPVFVARR